MKTLIKNGKIIKKDNHCVPAAIWIEEGIIRGMSKTFPETDFDEVIDAKEQLITPGLVNMKYRASENQALNTKKQLKRVVGQQLVVGSQQFAQCLTLTQFLIHQKN